MSDQPNCINEGELSASSTAVHWFVTPTESCKAEKLQDGKPRDGKQYDGILSCPQPFRPPLIALFFPCSGHILKRAKGTTFPTPSRFLSPPPVHYEHACPAARRTAPSPRARRCTAGALIVVLLQNQAPTHPMHDEYPRHGCAPRHPSGPSPAKRSPATTTLAFPIRAPEREAPARPRLGNHLMVF